MRWQTKIGTRLLLRLHIMENIRYGKENGSWSRQQLLSYWKNRLQRTNSILQNRFSFLCNFFLFRTKQRTDTSDKNQVNEAVGLSFFFISWTITCLDGLILTNTCRKNTDREAIHFHFQERKYQDITNWLHAYCVVSIRMVLQCLITNQSIKKAFYDY